MNYCLSSDDCTNNYIKAQIVYDIHFYSQQSLDQDVQLTKRDVFYCRHLCII